MNLNSSPLEPWNSTFNAYNASKRIHIQKSND
jgi:hypothetical protein